MAKADCDRPPSEVVETDMMIVGGGICGILAAKMCADRRWPYVVVEKNPQLGGVWTTLANRHSYLQARLGCGTGLSLAAARDHRSGRREVTTDLPPPPAMSPPSPAAAPPSYCIRT